MNRNKKINNNDVINFYEIDDVKKKTPKYNNPCVEECGFIKHPFRMSVISASGGGKTNSICNLLKKMNDTFYKLIVVVPNKNEPLYEYLEEKLKDRITFYSNLNDMINVDEIEGDKQILIIFDDLVSVKNQKKIEDYMLRGRKKNISSIYISQSFFAIPQFIRLQLNVILLLKISSKNNLDYMLRDCNLGIEKSDMIKMYKDATKKKMDFFKILVDSTNDNIKYSHNFTEFYKLNDTDELPDNYKDINEL